MPTLITGNTTNTVAISNTTHVILAPGATKNVAGDAFDFDSGSAPGQLTIAGLVTATTDGVRMDGGDNLIVTQTGSIIATDGDTSDAIRLGGANNTVQIAGYVYGDDFGIIAQGTNDTVEITHSGVLQGGSNSFGDEITPFSSAIVFRNSATLVNSGTILADLNPGTGFRIAVANSTSNDANPNALEESTEASLDFTNNGLVRGDVFLAAGTDALKNAGVIDGEVDMGRDRDTYDGAGGVVFGQVKMGGGADTAFGGSEGDWIFGEDGADTLRGRAGEDTIEGGTGNDDIWGGAGDATLLGGEHDDTLRGGDGDDSVSGNSGNDSLVGNDGDDTLEGNGGSDT
ncbi:MAG: calcium-binding protein, partial [Pseudomonadota bacterium]